MNMKRRLSKLEDGAPTRFEQMTEGGLTELLHQIEAQMLDELRQDETGELVDELREHWPGGYPGTLGSEGASEINRLLGFDEGVKNEI